MSDSWIILIPENPQTVPANERQERALATFRQVVPDSEKVEIQTSENIRFVDCGENFERVLCPSCGKEIDNDWWSDRMSEDFDSGFRLKQFSLPCCKAKRTLNDLRYEWPQGFARFSLEAMNPNVAELPREQVTSLEAIVGCPLRVIYQHI
jgi:hypothetical protein